MYTNYDRYLDTNGYILVFIPDHPRSIKSGSFSGYVYEHILIAEEMIGRPLSVGDVVHHLDFNRSNNSPDNLLIISGPMHTKLHAWLSKNTFTPTTTYRDRISQGCVRCKICEKPIDYTLVYCSDRCMTVGKSLYVKPTKETLEKLVWEKPTTTIAKSYNVSDNAIAKLCKQLGIKKPPRGYWTKKKFERA